MKILVFGLLLVATPLTQPTPVSAGGFAEAAKAGGKLIIGKSVQTGARNAANVAAKSAASKAAKEAAEAAAAKTASSALRYLGDDAVRAGAKLAGAKGLSLVDDFAKVTARLSPQNQRRLMMLAPDLQKSGQASNALGLFAKGGRADDVMEMLWRHRGKIAAGAAVTTVVAHGDSIVEASSEHIVKPFAEVAATTILAPMAGPIRMLIGLSSLLVIVGVPAGGYWMYRRYYPLGVPQSSLLPQSQSADYSVPSDN